MSNQNSAGSAAIEKIAQAAIKARFPKAKLTGQFKVLADAVQSGEDAQEVKRATARLVCACAAKFLADALKDTSDISTISACWRDHWATLIPELQNAESPFIKLGEPNRDGEQKPVMTGYGRNIASAARGVIEHGIMLDTADGTKKTFVEINAEIVKARRSSLGKDARDLNTAKANLADASANLRKACKKSDGMFATAAEIVSAMTAVIGSYGEDGLIFLALYVAEFKVEDYHTESDADSSDNPTIDSESDQSDQSETDDPVVIAAN